MSNVPSQLRFDCMIPPLSQSTIDSIQKVLVIDKEAESKLPPPTPVQSACIPLLLTNKDVCVQALTGSGKTLTYVVPIAELLLRRPAALKPAQVGAVVVCPTRELAKQVHGVVRVFTRGTEGGREPLLCIGGEGTTAKTDLESFASLKSDVLVGTPGRLHDILTRYDTVDVRELDLLVLDEADTLLSMGFERQVGGILKILPAMRRTGLFSATMTRAVKDLSRAGLRNPVFVNVNVEGAKGAKKTTTPDTLTNYYLCCPQREKLSRLAAFLLDKKKEKSIVFFLTCAQVDFIGPALKSILGKNVPYLEHLHGKLNQKRRTATLERYKSAAAGSLLCTDVAARGLDVDDVNWVVQFDAPTSPDSFVHRVGRAARAGKTGKSLVLLSEAEESYVDFLRLRKVPVEEVGSEEDCARGMAGAKVEEIEDEDMDKDDGDGDGDGNGNGEKGKAVTVTATKTMTKDNEVRDILPSVLSLVMSDRDYLEKGTKAYTSYIRAYKEHECSFIFPFSGLDLGELATSFCLLRLPKMPELKDSHNSLSFTPAGPEVNIHAIAFKDKKREAARQVRLTKEMAAGGKNAKTLKAEIKKAEKLKRQKKYEEEQRAKGRNVNKKRGKNTRIHDEWDELAKEERLHKKLRSGKIDKEEYKRLMRGEDGKGGGEEFDDFDSDLE